MAQQINFPENPIEGGTWTDPANKVTYIFDGEKWNIDKDPTVGVNYWVRNVPAGTIEPFFFDADSVNAVGYRINNLPHIRTAP